MQKKILLKLHTLCSRLYEQEGTEAVSEDSTVIYYGFGRKRIS